MVSIQPNQLYTEVHSQLQIANTKPFCFEFFYYMFGDDVGVLSLTISHIDNFSNRKHEKFWTKSGSLADKWYRERITIMPQNYNFTVILTKFRENCIY